MPVFTFDEILKPFEYLDIGSLYNQYALLIDAIIAFLIFLGISQITIGKRFEGRGGKAITTGIGLALTAAFLLMEKSLNFSIRSFGPLAVAIILVLVGFVFYSMLTALGFSHINSLCLAYLIDYLSIRLVSPSIFDWIAATAPFINGILGICFLIALTKLLLSIFVRGSNKSLSTKLPSKVNIEPDTKALDKEIDEDKTEIKAIRSKLLRSTKKEIKNSDEMVAILEEMIRLIEEYGTAPQTIKELSDCLNKIKGREHYAADYFNYINKILDRIGRFDKEFYSDLKAEYETAQGREQKNLKKKEIETEEKKRELEEVLEKIEKLIQQYTGDFNQCLTGAVHNLQKSRPADAIQLLKDALKYEEKIKNFFEEMRDLESELKKLTKKNLKSLKKEKKASS